MSKEFKGKTLEEAIRNASDALNTKEENLHYVITSEKKGFRKEVSIEIVDEPQLHSDYMRFNDLDPLLKQTIEFITELMTHMDITIEEYELHQEEEGKEYYLNLQCGELGAVAIGKRGVVLNAIQFLVTSFSNKIHSPYFLMVDIDGYRKKQERNLREEVLRAADRVQKTQKPFLLKGPYSPIERKQIHIVVKNDFPLLSSVSEGESFLKSVWIQKQK